jgi:hypothetical protein
MRFVRKKPKPREFRPPWIEEFPTVEERNERYAKLKEQNTPGLSKFSTVRDNKSVWCVAH